MPYNKLNKNQMDMIYETQQGKIKVIYPVNTIYNFNSTKCSDLNEEKNYQIFVDKINEFKEHSALFSWYISDLLPFCFNHNLRNRTLTIHELGQNHPSLSVIGNTSDTNDLMNTTDIMGVCNYPVGLEKNK